MRTRTLPFALLALCCPLVAAAAAQALAVAGRVADGEDRTGNQVQSESARVRKPKRLPPGVPGFGPYAPRAPSDIRMATGGATRHIDEFEFTMARGHDLHDKGKYLEAIEYYARAAKMKPDSYRAFLALGIANEDAGRLGEAAAAYKTAAGLKPEPPDDPLGYLVALYGFANVQGAAGQHAEAVAVYLRLVDQLTKAGLPLSKPHARLRYNLALSLDALGRLREAIEWFKESVLIDPDYAEAWYNLGVAYGLTGQYGGAVGPFKQALRVNASYAGAHYNLGLAHYLTDDAPGLAGQLEALRALNSPLAGELAKLIGR